MTPYPINVPRDLYSGRDPARKRKAQRFNDLADRLEKYINAEMKRAPAGSRMFSYGMIALDLKLSEAEVENVLYGVDAGGNALTVWKRD
ncbi:MAG: hypothetical protein ABIL01_16835 [Pseudomonadota bacterium]